METIEIPPLAAATGESAPTAKPVAATTLTPIPVEKPAPVMPYPKEGATTYVVESGDSLSVIAAKHGASMADVMKVNGISNANKIRSGQTLYLPAKQAETADATAPEATSVEAAPATTGTDASVLNLPSITSGE